MTKATEASLMRQYKADLATARDKHIKAVAAAGAKYERGLKALDKADKPATVGKPSRSKAGGTRSRS